MNVRIACTECGFTISDPVIPPGILQGYSPEEAAGVIDRWIKGGLHVLDYGFCEYCCGRMEASVVRMSDLEREEVDEFGREVMAAFECTRCDTRFLGIVGLSLLAHPAVISFHYEHGIDLREVPFWNLDWAEVGGATVTNEDPLRVEVPITLEDDTLTLVVNESMDVVEERRT